MGAERFSPDYTGARERFREYLIRFVLIVAGSLISGATSAAMVTRGDIESLAISLVGGVGAGSVNKLATAMCGILVEGLGSPPNEHGGPRATVQSLLPFYPAEGSATVRLDGAGVSRLTERPITGLCSGTIAFKYRFWKVWNGVGMESHSEFTEGPTLVGPDGAPVDVDATTPTPGTGSLVITSDANCILRVDGVLRDFLIAGVSVTIEAMPGERLITCDSQGSSVTASEKRSIEMGGKAVVALSLAKPEKAKLATEKRVPKTGGTAVAETADVMIDRGGGVLEEVSSGLLSTRRDNASDITWSGAREYCAKLSISGGGWRLPSSREFHRLYVEASHVEKATPCGDTQCNASMFQLSSWWFWTGEANDSKTAWTYIFRQGYGSVYSYPVGASSGSRALCVRAPRAEEADTAEARAKVAREAASHKPAVDEKEIARGGGVIEQVSSGLLWTQRDNGSDLTLDGARQYCTTLSTSGGGWRLPSNQELYNLLLDAVGTKLVACGDYLCGVPPGFSFTSELLWAGEVDGSGKGEFIDFQQGMPVHASPNYHHARALCVRNP